MKLITNFIWFLKTPETPDLEWLCLTNKLMDSVSVLQLKETAMNEKRKDTEKEWKGLAWEGARNCVSTKL